MHPYLPFNELRCFIGMLKKWCPMLMGAGEYVDYCTIKCKSVSINFCFSLFNLPGYLHIEGSSIRSAPTNILQNREWLWNQISGKK